MAAHTGTASELAFLKLGGDAPRESSWHAHDQGQLFVIARGLMQVDTGDGRWIMPPGRIGWIPPRWPHLGSDVGEARGTSFYLGERHTGGLPASPRVFETTDFLAALLNRIEDAVVRNLDDGRKARLLAILTDELSDAREEPLHIPMPKDPRLAGIAEALLAAPDDRRTLDAWAAETGFSRRTLARRIAAETGLSFGRWRQQIRMMEALRRLSQGNSVTTAALSLGFESVSSFIAAFRNQLGTSPARYIRQRRTERD